MKPLVEGMGCVTPDDIEANKRKGFDVIVLDPPWKNRSAKRGKKYVVFNFPSHIYRYSALNHSDLRKIPIPQLGNKEGCIIFVWVTNKETYQRYIKENLFPFWKIEYCSTWYWLKVANTGEPVAPIDSVHRKPYEPLIVGTLGNVEQSLKSALKDTKILCSVPGIHSKKPPMKGKAVRD